MHEITIFKTKVIFINENQIYNQKKVNPSTNLQWRFKLRLIQQKGFVVPKERNQITKTKSKM